ncbi:hypothetical protein [Clostridium ljungdahlii]|uniref:Uncharacterized protein n=1 Tax=Clostridium ljungdahlii (strain ATCC 55383 / DSM 13528 / PETC) TaxID=748727 RepID=D8GU79_CLOLD|nr:hypothetical protein [Clostridium ljungdahlii]ADK14742.1 hypothetical protein CLJU_c16780 [Clostridium ljungdahlii DSM 13528]OAA84099.1 hypothetical protein WX45_01943 [Clostridium ljungdahlii DSM 13528]
MKRTNKAYIVIILIIIGTAFAPVIAHKLQSSKDTISTSQVDTQNDNSSTSTNQDNDSTSQIGTQTDNNSTQQDNDSTSKPDNSATTNKSTDFKEGEEITLSEDASVCSSKDNVDKMINYLQNKNEQAIENMENKGEAKVIPKGSNITIVKLGIVVEIEDSNGQDWYAPYEVFK